MAHITVQDMSNASIQVGRITFMMAASATVSALMDQVALSSRYAAGSFELALQRTANDTTTNGSETYVRS